MLASLMMRNAFVLLASFAVAACSGNASRSSGDGTGGTAGTGGSTSAGTGGEPVLGPPITAPSETWTWVPFSNAFCANGETTGIAVNLTTKSPRVLIWLEGGGACWSDVTCYTIMTAWNVTSGYDEAKFKADYAMFYQAGDFFDRTAAANPFKDYSYVFVPYCTGDVHAGDNVVMYAHGPASGTMHVGYKNMDAYLARIAATFPDADRVYLTGSSAGGFGASFNWWHVQRWFGKTRVDLIDDSGTPMPLAIWNQGFGEVDVRTAWNLAATFPPGCTQCATSIDGLLPFYRQTFPDHRMALLSYVQDSVLPDFYGISTQQFEMGLSQELTTYFAAGSPFEYFTNPGAGHVLWLSPTLTTSGVTLQEFLGKMVTDDPTWASVQ